jgi:hypothetical protein
MGRKYYIVEGAQCTCKFGSAPGILLVNSQQKILLNANKKVATSNELQNTFQPPGFGTCKFSYPSRPCAPVITQWMNVYQSMRLPGGAFPLMPDSKGTCAVCGSPCVEISDHGQVEIAGDSHVKNATAEHQTDLDTAGSTSGLPESDENDFDKVEFICI